MLRILPPTLARRSTLLRCALCLMWAGAGCYEVTARAADEPLSGEALFQHHWTVDDPLSPKGDGLGPYFNGHSCGECHHQGGTGGGGSNEHNVDLLSESSKANGLLHKFSIDPAYATWRFKTLGIKLRDDAEPLKNPITARAIERKLQRLPWVAKLPDGRLSHRNTTSLMGAGVIDRLNTRVLLQLEEQQPAQFPGIHGRAALFQNGVVGRFGWRGQVDSLRSFVLTACAMEIGLNVNKHHQASGPSSLANSPSCFGGGKPSGIDLDDEQCEALIAFVRSLPPPIALLPENQAKANLLNNGGALFHSVGCSACHPRTLGPIEGIYSDLLLHDLGEGLRDPVPAPRDPRHTKQVTVSGGYGGPSTIDEPQDNPRFFREWKTPPLWGVRDTAPYLHDGRAATLHDAIVLHGGEAASSVSRYKQLADPERNRLLMFVHSLGVEPNSELLNR